jgi:hypothetical protein
MHICLDKIQLIMGIGYNIHIDYENSNVLIINDGIDYENFMLEPDENVYVSQYAKDGTKKVLKLN